MLRAFFGRHKAASTWARNILHDAAAVLRLNILTVHMPQQYHSHGSLGAYAEAEQPDILIMTGPTQGEIDTLPPLRGFHLVRDPRDIIVSGYFSHRNSHPEVFDGIEWPELIAHRKVLLARDKESGLEAEIDFSHSFIEPMMTWNYEYPDMLEMRMEDMIADPIAQWTKVFTHLGMMGRGKGMTKTRWNLAAKRGRPRSLALLRKVFPAVDVSGLPPAYLHDVLERYSFSRLSKSDRRPGEVDEQSHYRKGVAGDWANHLSPKHLGIIDDRYGELMKRLGYR